ncbi:MAG: hypothetical protein B7Z55_04085 [Planctomycetales bacterium 12-60-4]|nr:MAG: hypothetical protein B7Z55_04085 [Planctomycetales bacterium 12-60-4]
MRDGRIPAAEISAFHARQIAGFNDEQLDKELKELWGEVRVSAAEKKTLIERYKVELTAKSDQQADLSAGRALFQKSCANCHVLYGQGRLIGPDLTGMAVHPKHELLIHILDPSRSVEGNFRLYTVELADGRVLSGMLAGESRTAIEIVDNEAKRHAIAREDIEDLVMSPKSVMPEGFEKQVKPEELNHLLEFLTQRGQFVPLDLRKVATSVSTQGMFVSREADAERLIFPDWTPKTFAGVPFVLVDPQGDRVPNVVLLNAENGTFPRTMPKSVELPCNMPVKALHFLSGVSGWGYPYGDENSVTMIVRLKYADGKVEDHPLRNGVEFADYIRVVDVPGSKLAFRLRGQQIRYFSVTPERPESIASVELVKGPDRSAPVVMAITAESR